MPHVHSFPALAALLEIKEIELRALAQAAHKLYRCWDEAKEGGGFRTIEAPFPRLKEIQQKVRQLILENLPIHECLYGGPGTSQIDAAKCHLGKDVVFTLDIRNFFPTVTSPQVFNALQCHGFNHAVGQTLTRLCTRKKRLPQGAPTSPTLARLVLSPILTRITGVVNSVKGDSLTQYVDDLAVSGPNGIQRAIPLIQKIFEQAGFEVHPKKVRIMRKDSSQIVLGLNVNSSLKVSDEFLKRLAEAQATLSPDHPSRKGMEAWRRRVARSN